MPTGKEAFAGVIAIETSAAAVTVSVVAPVIVPEVALIVAAPVPALVARPCVPATLLMLAMPRAEVLQITELVKFCWLPSVYVPVAVNCWVRPVGTDIFDGVTARDDSTGAVTVTLLVALIVPSAAVTVAVLLLKVERNPEALIVTTAGAEDVQVTALVKYLVLASV